MGFLIPPMLVKNGTEDEIGYQLSVMYYGTGAVTIVIFLLAVFCKYSTIDQRNSMRIATALTIAMYVRRKCLGRIPLGERLFDDTVFP